MKKVKEKKFACIATNSKSKKASQKKNIDPLTVTNSNGQTLSENSYSTKCLGCGNIFSAKTALAQFCTMQCYFKQRKKDAREKKIAAAITKNEKNILGKPGQQKSNLDLSTPTPHTIYPKDFYSIKEFAKMLGVHERTIMNHVWKNKLPHCRIGRRILINKKQVFEYFKIKDN